MLSAALILQAREKKGQTKDGVRTGREGLCTPTRIGRVLSPIAVYNNYAEVQSLSHAQRRRPSTEPCAPALFAVFGAGAGWGSICLEQSWVKIALFW